MDIIEKIPRYGMSKRCQKLLPRITKEYFHGKSLQYLKDKSSKKNKGCIQEIYKRIELTIKELSLDKITPLMGVHREDVKHDVAFVDTILKYCIHFRGPGQKLENKLLDAVKTENKEYNKKFRIFIKRRYNEEKSGKEDIGIVKSIKNQDLYLFIAKNIINKNS